jgi:hypothetical protein
MNALERTLGVLDRTRACIDSFAAQLLGTACLVVCRSALERALLGSSADALERGAVRSILIYQNFTFSRFFPTT